MALILPRMAYIYAVAAVFWLYAVPALSSPTHPPGGPDKTKHCAAIDKRQEWRDMSIKDRKAWSQAVLCLSTKPALSSWGGATTRYEQFAAAHMQLFEQIHIVGQFLPWHRHMVTLFHDALRQECGYTGPAPYWDWPRDADAPGPLANSPIFDPVHGLGGDGVPGTYTPPEGDGLHGPWTAKGCIDSGPFKDMVNRVGPGSFNDPHCVARGFNETFWRPFMTGAAVKEALMSPDFNAFIEVIDRDGNGIHGGGHGFVGGDMTDGSGPVDPLFYLHHAQLDRIWWQWQQANPAERLYAIGGPTQAFPVPNNITTTLEDIMLFPGLGQTIPVGEVMDASAYPSCFTY